MRLTPCSVSCLSFIRCAICIFRSNWTIFYALTWFCFKASAVGILISAPELGLSCYWWSESLTGIELRKIFGFVIWGAAVPIWLGVVFEDGVGLHAC